MSQVEDDGAELLRVLNEASFKLRDEVRITLNRAVFNGHHSYLTQQPVGTVVRWLRGYDTDLQGVTTVVLTFLVISWRREREKILADALEYAASLKTTASSH